MPNLENFCKYRGKYTRKSEIAKFIHRGYELQARYNRTPLISIYVKIFSKEIQEWYTYHFTQTLDHASCRISPKKRDFEHVLCQTHHLGCFTRCCLPRKKRWSFHSRFVLTDSQRRRARCCPKIVKVATALPTARHSTIKLSDVGKAARITFVSELNWRCRDFAVEVRCRDAMLWFVIFAWTFLRESTYERLLRSFLSTRSSIILSALSLIHTGIYSVYFIYSNTTFYTKLSPDEAR